MNIHTSDPKGNKSQSIADDLSKSRGLSKPAVQLAEAEMPLPSHSETKNLVSNRTGTEMTSDEIVQMQAYDPEGYDYRPHEQESYPVKEAWHSMQASHGSTSNTAQLIKEGSGIEKPIKQEAGLKGMEANEIGSETFYNAPIHPIQPQKISTPIIQRAGYTHQELITRIQNELGHGICNALTAAWLAGQLNASSADGTTGVTDQNWANIVALKSLLDLVVANNYDFNASDVTRAFLPYLTEKGAAWFNGLAALNIGIEVRNFSTWIRNEYEPSNGLEMQNVREDYDELTDDAVGHIVSEALEEKFTLGRAFSGIVVISAFNDENARFGHEFAVSYTPGTNTFEIFDQNSGLTTFVISSDDDIIDELTRYIRNGYVLNPMGDSTSADIEVTFDFGEEEDDDD